MGKSVFCSCRCLTAVLVVIVAWVIGTTLYIWPQRVTCKKCRSPYTLQPAPAELSDPCARDSQEFNAKDIETKGYAVARNWLPEAERKELLRIWQELPGDEVTNPGGNGGQNAGYKAPKMTGVDIFQAVPALKQRILDLAVETSKETNINIINTDGDIGTTPLFFHTNASAVSSLRFGWHQDFENFLYFQNLTKFLNVYIFLQKPDPKEAGVTLVPWDVLKARSPDFYEHVRNGATGDEKVNDDWHCSTFRDNSEGGMTVTDAVYDTESAIDFRLDDVACTPHLSAGDLLVFRGDTIHRTQEHNSHRTSLNVLTFPYQLIDPAKLFYGGHTKYLYLNKSYKNYLYFTYLWGRYVRGREHLHARVVNKLYNRPSLFGGYYLRTTLAPVRHAMDKLLDVIDER